MNHDNLGFTSRAIHAGSDEYKHGPLNTPIYQTSTFWFDSCGQGGCRFTGEEKGYIYTRLGNPTLTAVEKVIASLEGSEAAVSFASGMGAISSTVWSICKAGAHVVADVTLYGCTHALLLHGMTRYGVEITFADLSNLENLKGALRPNTALVYMESPANPNLKIIDIAGVADVAHGYNAEIKVVCDNTFATPYLQRPLALGCDVVVHSATKYLNGHGDVIAGFACGTEEFMGEVRMFGLKDMTGAVLGPFEAFLIARGLKTLTLRMDRHCENALALVEFLKKHPKIRKVYFPGLPDHPNHEIAKRQMSKFGGMVSFEVVGGREAGEKLLNNMKLCVLAVSLGDAETLVEHPASMTHSVYATEDLEKSGIPVGLVRVSVGLEDIEDIIADFEQSLAAL